MKKLTIIMLIWLVQWQENLFCQFHPVAGNADSVKVYPLWVPWTNVMHFGAKGDGVTDDTKAIQAAIQSKKNSRQIYFPPGVYLVSKPLVGLNIDSLPQSWLQLYGSGKNCTTIRLMNNADSFQDSLQPQAVLRFRGGRERINGVMSERPNLAFFNSVYDMTIDIGAGNPGAIGIDWVVSNAGTLRHVNVKSSDPEFRGYIGVRMNESDGTGYIADLTITGFSYGWWRAGNAQSLAAEGLRLLHQRKAGIYNINTVFAINNLYSENTVPTIIQVDSIAQASVLNATIRGDARHVFVQLHKDAMLYLRNIEASGASALVRYPAGRISHGASISRNTRHEWFSHPPVAGSGAASLELPVKSVPEYHSNDTGSWVLVSHFPDDGTGDYSVRLQHALNSGGQTIVMDGSGSQQYKSPVIVPAHVKRIMGFWQSSAASAQATFEKNKLPLLSVESGNLNHPDSVNRSQWFMEIAGNSDTALVIEAFHHFPGGIFNNAKRPLVLRDMNLPAYLNTSIANADLFTEDIHHGSNYRIRHGQHGWLRNIDAVFGEGPDIIADHSTVWLLSLRSEGGGVFVKVVNNGTVEIIGTSHFIGSNGVGQDLAYDVEDGSFSIINYSELGFMRHGIYQQLVADRKRKRVIKRNTPGVFSRYKMNRLMMYSTAK